MRVKEIEQMIASMDGGRLLNELIVFAAMHLDQHANKEEDNMDAFVRAFEVRLAETGIAQKHHAAECRFMRGEGLVYCQCSNAHWSWPRQGLT